VRAITGILLIFLSALPGLAQEPAPKARTRDSTPDYYPLKVGSKWHYQVETGNGQKVTIVHQITKIENRDGKPTALLEESVNGEVQASGHVGVEADGVFRYGFKGTKVSPPVCLLKYPVKEGSSWETETTIGNQQYTVSARSRGAEEVQVPAGKYQAVPVKIETTVKGDKVSNTYWFAPDVGIVKQLVDVRGRSYSMELLKFEEGK
jgi:hypothetical protein